MNASNPRHHLLPASDLVSRQLSVREPAELLAYIIHTLGFEPKRSWVGVAVREKRLGAVMRGDLPPTLESVLIHGVIDTSDEERVEHHAQQLGGYVATQLRNDVEADRLLLVYFLDDDQDPQNDTSMDGADAPLRNAIDRVDRSMRRGTALNRLPVFESWVLRDRRVWHLYCGHRGDCVTQGSPVGEPRGTLVSDSLTLLGHPIEPDYLTVTLPDPSSDPGMLPQAPYEDDTVACWNWLRSWDEILESGRPIDAAEAAVFAAPLENTSWRDLLMVGACFGFENAVSGLAAASRIPAGLENLFEAQADDYCARLAAETLTGRTGRGPNWSRLDLLRRYCEDLVPQATPTVAAVTAAIAAWIEWARGRGSHASGLLDQAVSWNPSCSLAVLLAEAVRFGMINPWALDRDIAWSGRDRSAA